MSIKDVIVAVTAIIAVAGTICFGIWTGYQIAHENNIKSKTIQTKCIEAGGVFDAQWNVCYWSKMEEAK